MLCMTQGKSEGDNAMTNEAEPLMVESPLERTPLKIAEARDNESDSSSPIQDVRRYGGQFDYIVPSEARSLEISNIAEVFKSLLLISLRVLYQVLSCISEFGKRNVFPQLGIEGICQGAEVLDTKL